MQPNLLGQSLRKAREESGLGSIAKAAEALGLNKNTLGGYERGEWLPDVDFLASFARATGHDFWDLLRKRMECSLADGARDVLAGWDAPRKPGRRTAEPPAAYQVGQPATDPLRDFVMVPRYDVSASAGHGALVHSEQVVDYLAFRADWVRAVGLQRDALALVEASGDSMEPTLTSGDLLLVDLRVRDPGGGGVFALRVDGALVVKRLARELGGGVFVKADNPAYPSHVVDAATAATLEVIGRVVWACKRL